MNGSLSIDKNIHLPGVIPWWTLNSRLSKPEARRQLDDFLEKGIMEFFLYPNFGLEYPGFLSDEWFEFITFIVDECRERKMHFWIYDELNWPSGSSGGLLCRDYPEYCMRVQRWHEYILKPGDSWHPDAAAEYIWAGVFVEAEEKPRLLDASQDYLNDSGHAQKLCLIEKLRIDDYFLCSMGTADTWNQPGILDALNPVAVKKWMSFNYEPYATHFHADFGNVIRGFFFDEPTMVSPFHTGDCPWTDGLDDIFLEQYGYDCMPLLWTLFKPVTGCEQFRYDFWRLVALRFAKSFTGQLSDWCEQNGLMLSGHCWPEEPSCQRLMTNVTGDIHYMQQYLHVPGTDFLYCENCYAESAGMNPTAPGWARNLIYSAKHASSTARYNNAVYSICESSGICELGTKGAPPSAQKLAYDFLFAMGISLMNPARPFDMSDFRKHVCALDAGQPYWKYYGDFSRYMNTLSLFNSRGRTCTEIAVLNPVSSKFALSDISPDTSIRKEITELPAHARCAEPMLAVLDALVRKHLDFELLFEEIVLDSAIGDNGELLAPNSAFKLIILPQCYALDDAVWQKLQQFAARGGRLIAVGDAPVMPLRHGKEALPVNPLPVKCISMEEKEFADVLATEIAGMVAGQYALNGANNDEVLALLRQEGSWQGLFLANGTPGEKCIELSGPFANKVQCCHNLQNGMCCKWTAGLPLRLKEGESLILSTEASDDVICDADVSPVMELPKDGWRIAMPCRNAVRLKLECLIDGAYHPLCDNGVSDILLDPDVMPVVSLRGVFVIEEAVPDDLRLWMDNGNFSDLLVNGIPVSERQQETLIDPANITVPISRLCKKGENIVTVNVALSKWLKADYGIRRHFDILMNGCSPLVVLGSFAAMGNYSIQALPQSLHCGSLEEQGFPQFSDELSVVLDFDCPVFDKCSFIGLQGASLPVSVFLNDVYIGTRLWKNGNLPLRGNLLKAHGNRLVLKLCGDVWNMLERRWLGIPVEHIPFAMPELFFIGNK